MAARTGHHGWRTVSPSHLLDTHSARLALAVALTLLLVPSPLAAVEGGSVEDAAAGTSRLDVAFDLVSHETTQGIGVWAPAIEGSWPVAYLLHCHACSWADSAPLAEELASRGMVVFAPDYRSTATAAEIEPDLECGYRYVRSIAHEYGGDLTQPLTFVGDSLGASFALIYGVALDYFGPGGAFDRCFSGVPRPDVIVGIAGCYYEYDGRTVFYSPLVAMTDHADLMTREPSLTLVVGEADDVCAPWQSEQAADELQDAGYDVSVILVPDGNHDNVALWSQVDGEWTESPGDPVGLEVVEIILEAVEAAAS